MLKIEDYGIIGNGRSAALISKEGSVDWLCWPRFDSPSFFGALVDSQIGGSWKIQPTTNFKIERNYIEETNVLQTHFQCETGKMILTDFMTAFSEKEKNQQLHPEHELIRIIECVEGYLEVDIHFQPAPNYGQTKPLIRDLGKLGLRIEMGQQIFSLHSTISFDLHKKQTANKQIKLKAGDTLYLSLAHSMEGPAVLPSISKELITDKLSKTIKWWQEWARKSQYKGPYKKQVVRSALALKLLGYAPSGAFVAAPTTSLPERLGGDLNWDYRFCWLRDASFTVRALLGLGYFEEVEAFVSWMLHSTRLTLPELKVVYDVFGEKMQPEVCLPHLKGYANSYPVRIGIATRDQLQLDVYGEVIDGVSNFVRQGGKLDSESKKMIRKIGQYVCKNWALKDSGIWEERSDFQHYTFSRLMCWVTLDQLLKIKEESGLTKKEIKKFEENRSLIRKEIEEEGWNKEMEAYTSFLGGKQMDISVLLMPSFGFDQATSQRMQKTRRKIEERLQVGPGLIYRYEKSIGNEGAFLLCSFWKVDWLARGGGTMAEADEEFKKVLQYANDLGLYSEEVDPKTGDSLGNFPQAFSHVGLINAAIVLEEKGNELG